MEEPHSPPLSNRGILHKTKNTSHRSFANDYKELRFMPKKKTMVLSSILKVPAANSIYKKKHRKKIRSRLSNSTARLNDQELTSRLIIKGRDIVYSSRKDMVKKKKSLDRNTERYNMDLQFLGLKRKTRNLSSQEYNSQAIKPANFELDKESNGASKHLNLNNNILARIFNKSAFRKFKEFNKNQYYIQGTKLSKLIRDPSFYSYDHKLTQYVQGRLLKNL
ncbi:unnamed protein product [Moneuplotes crassus]|uniref:Uncharacterized protein n=1 Tax=Euplotes crassus TaxID=5936 RepID=A0AAD1XCX4_EUPCR|nr:unnamed protein product [Moneuplotes crassus]